MKQSSPECTAKERTERTPSITGVTSDIRTKYDIQNGEIGHGHYGVVRKCRNRETKHIYAVKSIKKSKVGRIDSLKREVQILRAVDHPNIIKLYDIYEDDKFLHLVMELCEGGELFDRIIAKTQSSEGHYSEADCARLVQKITRAINYCHTIHNICHRDLKPENFIFKTKEENSELKIIDFGLSRYEDVGIEMTTRVGTPYYIAPEVLNRRYDKSCDLWSIGVIMYILICGYPPFYGDTDAEIFASVKKGEFNFPSPEWDTISTLAKTLIQSLLSKEPSARPTAQQVLQHEWFSHVLHDNFECVPIYESINASLKRFVCMNNLKKVALNVIAHQLSEAEIGQLSTVFSKLDGDGNGVISIEELERTLVDVEPGNVRSQVESLMQAADIDGNNCLDYREFLAATMERSIFVKEENIRQAFKYFDVDKKNSITLDNLVQTFGSEELAFQILGDVDTDGDGQISFAEFKTMMEENSVRAGTFQLERPRPKSRTKSDAQPCDNTPNSPYVNATNKCVRKKRSTSESRLTLSVDNLSSGALSTRPRDQLVAASAPASPNGFMVGSLPLLSSMPKVSSGKFPAIHASTPTRLTGIVTTKRSGNHDRNVPHKHHEPSTVSRAHRTSGLPLVDSKRQSR